MSGTFTLQLGGIDVAVAGSTNIPFDVDDNSLHGGIRNSISGMDDIVVTRKGDPLKTATWII